MLTTGAPSIALPTLLHRQPAFGHGHDRNGVFTDCNPKLARP